MSSYIVGAILGAGTTVIGFVLSAKREDRHRIEDRRSAQREDVMRAMREYIAALSGLVEASQWLPDIKREPDWRLSRFDKALDRLLRGSLIEVITIFVIRIIERVSYGPRNEALADRVAAATAHLRLVASPAVQALVDEADTLLRSFRPRDPEWTASWKTFQIKLRQGFREELERLSGARWAKV